MILFIDVGNTNINFCVSLENKIINSFRITTMEKTEDEYFSVFKAILNNKDINISDFKNVVLSSVVPKLNNIFKNLFKKYLNKSIFIIEYSKKINFSFKLKIEKPHQIGADRLCNAEFAAVNYPNQNTIIVDLGTATTFDVINKNNEYIGGIISPGIVLSANSLFNNTSKLFSVDYFSIPKKIIGKNTEECLKSGIVFGYASMIEGLIKQIKKSENFKKVNIIATGGLCDLFKNIVPSIKKKDILLNIKGMKLIYEKNM